jgi:hypothetical protein
MIITSISFAVVYEPEDEEQECEDIGYSYVDIQKILEQKQNYNNIDIPRNYIKEQQKLLKIIPIKILILLVYDADSPETKIGSMVVTVEIVDALNAIIAEMQPEMTTQTSK